MKLRCFSMQPLPAEQLPLLAEERATESDLPFPSPHTVTEGVLSHSVLLRNGTAVALTESDRKELAFSLLSV